MLSSMEALQLSMCPPPLWAHHPHQMVWQSIMNGLAIPSCIRIAHQTISCSLSHMLGLPWTVRVAPFRSQGYGLIGRGCGQLQPSTPSGSLE